LAINNQEKPVAVQIQAETPETSAANSVNSRDKLNHYNFMFIKK
jgi:hypothetical protein